ncbi:MAG: hypothetical protein ACREUV_06490 [Burkholderiales bacterium]
MKLCLIAVLYGLLFGCTVIKEVTRSTSEVEDYLAYYSYAANLSGEDLKKEYGALNQTYAKRKSDANRVRLALLLSLPGTGFRDDARALGLLKEVKTSENSELKDFTSLLAAHIAEHRKQEEKIKTEQGRADEMEQKLEALKSIERSIIERQQTPPVKIK